LGLNLKKIIRADEWWGYKLSPLLGIAYATTLIANASLLLSINHIFFLLLSLITGAAYVSIINNVTDAKEDMAAGKINYMLKYPPHLRWIVSAFFVLAGIVFMYFFYPDKLSLGLYIMSWVAFSLYSIPPVRFKTKGILGVFADASGAHLFPGCLIVTSLYFFWNKPVNWPWLVLVAIWALMLGLRGILSHQFDDRDKDIATGVNTYASKINPLHFKNKAKLLIVIELCAFGIMLFLLWNWIVVLFLALYISYVVLRCYFHKTKTIIIIINEKENYRVLMNEYYQVFLPISILLYIAIHQPYGWIILLLHIIIFYKIIYLTFNEFFNKELAHRIIRKYSGHNE
jgi:hypothetical protein